MIHHKGHEEHQVEKSFAKGALRVQAHEVRTAYAEFT
jgi:hypothetical protein